jgi:hypothetical protein
MYKDKLHKGKFTAKSKKMAAFLSHGPYIYTHTNPWTIQNIHPDSCNCNVYQTLGTGTVQQKCDLKPIHQYDRHQFVSFKKFSGRKVKKYIFETK